MPNINHFDIQVKIALYKEDIESMLSIYCKIICIFAKHILELSSLAM